MSTTVIPAPTATAQLKLMNFGVDTYMVNVKLVNSTGQPTGEELPEQVQATLSGYQLEAKQARQPWATPLTYHGQTLFVREHGANPWQWILFNDLVSLHIGRGTMNGGTFCQARLSSFCLWTLGPEQALLEVEGTLYDLVERPFHLQASEIHLCCDLTGWDVAMIDWQASFVSRVVKVRNRPELPAEQELAGGLSHKQGQTLDASVGSQAVVTSEHRRIATLDFGTHGSDLSCCIYNKSLEIRKSRKTWFVPIWERNGYDGTSTVWRIEFRFKRDFLASIHMNEAYTLLEHLASLWQYATVQWLRYVDLQATESNRSRLPSTAAWMLVQGAFTQDRQTVPEPVIREKRRMSRLKACVAAIAGYASSAAALAGEEVAAQPDLLATLVWLFEQVGEYHHHRHKTHLEDVWKKRLAYGFVTAQQYYEEVELHGVALPKDDWRKIDELVHRFKQSS